MTKISETLFLNMIRVIAEQHGFTVDIDLESRTFNFEGPDARRMELIEALAEYGSQCGIPFE